MLTHPMTTADLTRELVRGHASKASLERLVAQETAEPGHIDRFCHDLFHRKDGPLHRVNERTEMQRVGDTAAARWNVTPSSIEQPADLAGLVALLEHARDTGQTLRFAGSARSLSNASQPAADGSMVATCAYGSALAVETQTLKEGVDASGWYRAEGGRVLADVLLDLTDSGRCLADMGSGDFQTLAGALSTSTHGSGVSHGAFPALVQSLDVVSYAADGSVVVQRVEPADGPTDPAKFAAWVAEQAIPIELVQDDAQFQCWTVSMGCLGAIYSITLTTVPRYWLRETRTVEWWSDIQANLATELRNVDYFELLLSPLATDNEGTSDHACLVTRRVKVEAPPGDEPINGRPLTMAVAQTVVGHLATEASVLHAMRDPLKRVPSTLHEGLHASVVPAEYPYTDRDVEILLLRLDINATSSELAIPLTVDSAGVDPTNAIAAANDILAHAAQNQQAMGAALGSSNPYDHNYDELLAAWETTPLHTSPIALRFVAADPAYLSMQYGQPCCMIEMPMPGADCYDRDLVVPPTTPSASERLYAAYNKGRINLFRSTELRLRQGFGARPHWGQVNFLDWATTEALFPKAAAWRALYDQRNALGVFDGPITDQLGISTGGAR